MAVANEMAIGGVTIVGVMSQSQQNGGGGRIGASESVLVLSLIGWGEGENPLVSWSSCDFDLKEGRERGCDK